MKPDHPSGVRCKLCCGACGDVELISEEREFGVMLSTRLRVQCVTCGWSGEVVRVPKAIAAAMDDMKRRLISDLELRILLDDPPKKDFPFRVRMSTTKPGFLFTGIF